MDTLALSQTDTRRLEKLALAAGRTPRAVLKYVLRNGFAVTEDAVKKPWRACNRVSASRIGKPCCNSTG